ncbi:hypothetical protein VTH82DRAFT_8136 [Thermothelomyces myriococcoides]
MPSMDTEAQFKFLLCCIKHSAAGKINFENVAEELGIVSKAAAAKRYERLLKAHNISPSTPRKGAASGDTDAAEDGEEPKTPASKKRKRAGAAKKDEDEDDTPVKKERAVKDEPDAKKEESEEGEANVKGEGEGMPLNNINNPLLPYPLYHHRLQYRHVHNYATIIRPPRPREGKSPSARIVATGDRAGMVASPVRQPTSGMMAAVPSALLVLPSQARLSLSPGFWPLKHIPVDMNYVFKRTSTFRLMGFGYLPPP